MITDEYAAAIIDTRARVFHNTTGPVLSLQIPQGDIARALVEHFGVGEVRTFTHPATGKVFNEVVLEGMPMVEVLMRVYPHLISRRFDVEVVLREMEGQVA